MKTAMKKLFSLVLVAVLLVGVMPFQAFADGVPYYRIISPSEGDKPLTEATAMVSGQSYDVADFPIPSGYAFDYATNNGNPITLPIVAADGDVILVFANPASHTHSYTEAITTDPTCTATGVKTFTCSCGDFYTEDIAVLAHTFVSGKCSACSICEVCNANPCTCSAANYMVTINVTKDGRSTAISSSYPDGAVLTLNAALVNEVAFGGATVEWVVNGTHMATGNTVTVNGNMTISCSITNNNAQSVYLNANGGRLQSYVSPAYPVVIGQPYGNLPTPIREGYQFAYWYYQSPYGGEVSVNNSTIVKDTSMLNAKWIANAITVTFERYDLISGWVTVGEDTVAVPVNSQLSVADGTFPSDSRIKQIYKINDFEIKGWKIAETGADFLPNYTSVTQNITLRPKYQGTVKLEAQEPVTGASWKTSNITVEIGKPIGELMNPGPRSTFIFDGWVAKNGSGLICDRFCKSTKEYYPALGNTFNVRWEGGITVNLHIHVDGNTKTADKIVPYYVAPAEGVFDMKVIDMYSIYPAFYQYDDNCDKIYGWYDSEEWKNYCANRASHPATSYTDIEEHKQFDFHIMLINNGEGSSYTADSTNPKTGDMIFTTVSVMGASAACLAVLFYLNKKRAF